MVNSCLLTHAVLGTNLPVNFKGEHPFSIPYIFITNILPVSFKGFSTLQRYKGDGVPSSLVTSLHRFWTFSHRESVFSNIVSAFSYGIATLTDLLSGYKSFFNIGKEETCSVYFLVSKYPPCSILNTMVPLSNLFHSYRLNFNSLFMSFLGMEVRKKKRHIIQEWNITFIILYIWTMYHNNRLVLSN